MSDPSNQVATPHIYRLADIPVLKAQFGQA